VAGSLRASGKGSTCRWKAPRIGEAARVDARAVEAILVLRRSLVTGGRGARQGRQRPVRRPCARLRTPRQGSAALERGSSPLHLMRGTRAGRPKLVRRRQTLIHLGSDCRKVVRRRYPDGIGANAPAHLGGGLRGASCGLGSRAIFGCSYRTSVAEIGAKHLPGEFEVSREASQEGAG